MANLRKIVCVSMIGLGSIGFFGVGGYMAQESFNPNPVYSNPDYKELTANRTSIARLENLLSDLTTEEYQEYIVPLLENKKQIDEKLTEINRENIKIVNLNLQEMKKYGTLGFATGLVMIAGMLGLMYVSPTEKKNRIEIPIQV